MSRPCSLVLALIFAVPPVARADDAEKIDMARAHLKSGIAYYEDGHYEEASKEIESAYALKPLPDLQYNLAQCYERLARFEESRAAYGKYLAGKPGADDRVSVEHRIEALEARIAQMKAGEKPAPPPVEKVVFKEVIIYREAPPPPGRGARFAAYGLGVLALGALAAGISFAVLASRDASAVEASASPSAPPVFAGRFADTQAAGQTDVIVSYVGFGAAAVLAAGAIGLYALGRKIDREAPRLTVAPLASPTGGGLALSGSF